MTRTSLCNNDINVNIYCNSRPCGFDIYHSDRRALPLHNTHKHWKIIWSLFIQQIEKDCNIFLEKVEQMSRYQMNVLLDTQICD
jgi:hypothetical protein